MGLAEDLLEQTEHLAKRDEKRPRQASLRRAVSTTYYAIFHLLVSEAVTYWKIERHRATLARSFEHKRMKDICSRLKSQDADLLAVANAFVQFQQARHLADYDYTMSLPGQKC